MGSQQINILVATLMASFLAPGSISYIYFSDRLHELVLGVTVMSIGSVVFPEMSELSARKDRGRLGEIYSLSVRSALFMAIPATVALMVAGFPIVSVLLMHNRFTSHEAVMTYRALFCASTGIVAIAVCRITVPLYFALGDPRTPFFAALASFAVNAVCGYFLMRTPLRHAGLTLSVAIAATAQMAILLVLLKRKRASLRAGEIALSALKQCVAAACHGRCWSGSWRVSLTGSMTPLSRRLALPGDCWYPRAARCTWPRALSWGPRRPGTSSINCSRKEMIQPRMASMTGPISPRSSKK